MAAHPPHEKGGMELNVPISTWQDIILHKSRLHRPLSTVWHQLALHGWSKMVSYAVFIFWGFFSKRVHGLGGHSWFTFNSFLCFSWLVLSFGGVLGNVFGNVFELGAGCSFSETFSGTFSSSFSEAFSETFSSNQISHNENSHNENSHNDISFIRIHMHTRPDPKLQRVR